MDRTVKLRLFSLTLCLACLLTGSLAGCAKRKPVADAPIATAQQPLHTTRSATSPLHAQTEQATYEQGVQAFDAGQYKKAAATWRECLTETTDPAARQRALFALVAVKILQAGTESDLATAMDMLEEWLKNTPPGGSGEEARLLVPVLRTFRPGFALKEAKNAGDKECAKKLSEKSEQVRRMQQQVKALETIHREIQEKKKGLNNY